MFAHHVQVISSHACATVCQARTASTPSYAVGHHTGRLSEPEGVAAQLIHRTWRSEHHPKEETLITRCNEPTCVYPLLLIIMRIQDWPHFNAFAIDGCIYVEVKSGLKLYSRHVE